MSKATRIAEEVASLLGKGGKKATQEEVTAALRATLKSRRAGIVRNTQDRAVEQIERGAPTTGMTRSMGKVFNPMPPAAELRSRDGSGIISASNSANQIADFSGRDAADISEQEVRDWNKQRTRDMMAELRAAGLNFSPAYGIYGGAPEVSFVVHGGQGRSPSVDEWLMSLGDKYHQEAVINPAGMVFTRGLPDSPKPFLQPYGGEPTMYARGQNPTDYFSDVYGDGFTLDFNFDNDARIPVELGKLFRK